MKSYDLIAPFYDEDMGRNNNGDDISFYLSCAQRNPGNILELGCGTGRMTIPLLKSGFSVLGMDSSPAMIRQLVEKKDRLRPEEQQRLILLCEDMRYLGLRQKYKTVCCAFSLLTYMVSDEDLTVFFQNVRDHMEWDGQFVLDVFLPQAHLQSLPDDRLYFDYRRPWKDTFCLERSKQIIKHPGWSQNTIRRFYRFMDGDLPVAQNIVTEERIRLFYRPELCALLTDHGFQIRQCWGGFRQEPLTEDSPVMVFVCNLTGAIDGYER